MAGEKQYIYYMHAVDPAKAVTRDNWTDYDRETFDLHWENLERLKADGVLIAAGRPDDPTGAAPAIVLFEADSDEDARRIADAEPFVKRGFATVELYPFRGITIPTKDL